MPGPASRSRSKSGVARRERSWLDAILELDDGEPRPPPRSASRPSVAVQSRAAVAAVPPSRSLPAISERCAPVAEATAAAAGAESAGVAWGTAAETEAETEAAAVAVAAAPAVLYSRAQAFAGQAVASREAIESAYVAAKKELGVRMHQEDCGGDGGGGRAGGLAQWQQDALAQQLQLELQAVRRRLLEADREREALRRLVAERQAQAEEMLRAERARRRRGEEEAALLRRERDLLLFGAGAREATAAQRQQQELARELLEGEVRLLKRSLLLAHEQATGGEDGVAECLAAVRGLAADLAHAVEAFQRSGARLEETVRARQKLETAAVTKLRELLQQQQPSAEECCFHAHVARVEEALRRVEELYDLAVADPAPLTLDDCPPAAAEFHGEHSRTQAIEWGGGGGGGSGIVAALEASADATENGGSGRKATSDSTLAVAPEAVATAVSPALTFAAPRAYSSSPEGLPSTASLLLFGGAPPEQ